MSKDLDERVVRLETQVEEIKNSMNGLREKVDQNFDMTYEIKNHIAKQNGILPRMEASLFSVEDKIDKITVRVESTSLKLKIIWGILGTVCGGIFAISIKFLFDHLFGG